MSTKSTVVLFDRDGNDLEYKRLSARLDAFYQAFPPKEGWQVVIRSTPGSEFGIEGAVIFKASLLDKRGREINSGSACIRPNVYKDWEKGETAARQRLLAGIGFGGECLDDDEDRDIQDQGRVYQAPEEVTPIRATAKQATAQSAEEPVAKADPAAKQEATEQPRKAERQVQPAPQEPAAKQVANSAGSIPEYIINGINAQRAMRNLDPVKAEDFESEAEAKAALKDLMTS